MNTRAVHKALSYLESHACWHRDGDTEWCLIGDGVSYDSSRLQALADSCFKSEKVVVSVDRETAFEVARENLATSLNASEKFTGRSFGRILVTDFYMTAIIELKDIGVARWGSIEENAQALEFFKDESS